MDEHVPELGQAIFSHGAFHEVAVSRHVHNGLLLIGEAIGTKRGDWDRSWGSLTSNSGADPYEDDVFVMRTFCWCDGDAAGHEELCPPNFEFKSTDLKVSWYKHAGRGDSMNRRVEPQEWAEIEAACLASLGITMIEIEARRAKDAMTCTRCGRPKEHFTEEDLQSIQESGLCVPCIKEDLSEDLLGL